MTYQILSVVFWASAALVAFTFAGYPLWLWLKRPLPCHARRSPVALPTVSIIMAVHDAERLVGPKLSNLLSLDYPPELIEVVVACDGRSDRTAAACRERPDPRVRVLEFDCRRGKASCLNDAAAVATGEVLLMVDVRQRVDPQALRALVSRLEDPAVGVAGGELRFEDPDTGFAASVDAYWRYETAIRRAESRSGSVVGVSGALYAIRRRLFQPIPQGTVLDDMLIPLQAAASGTRVVLEPGAIAWDRASPTSGAERVRKVRTLAGNLQLVQLAPWLLDPRANPLLFRFVCHKLLRLAVPWALLALLLAAAALAFQHRLYLAFLMAAIASAVLVALAAWFPSFARVRAIRMLTAFLHMNVYAAQATIAFARRPSLHLW